MKKLSLVLGTLLVLGSSLTSCDTVLNLKFTLKECSYSEALSLYNQYKDNATNNKDSLKTVKAEAECFFKNDEITLKVIREIDINDGDYYYHSYETDTNDHTSESLIFKRGDLYSYNGEEISEHDTKKIVVGLFDSTIFAASPNDVDFPKNQTDAYNYKFYMLSDKSIKIVKSEGSFEDAYHCVLNSNGYASELFRENSEYKISFNYQFNIKLDKKTSL